MNTDTSNEAANSSEEKQESGEAAASADPVAELQAKLQEAEKKYLYLYSEFENFRRRNERDRSEFLKFGHEGFLRDLLQVVDNFERAVVHAKSVAGEKGSVISQVCQGVEMIHFQLMESLKAQGVQMVNTGGAKFDPALHEAVGDEASELEAGTILKEVQRGYTLHGKLLRAARVIVAKN
jgi:molecular chaperone GrpE